MEKGHQTKEPIFNSKPSELMEGFRKCVLGNQEIQAEVREAKSVSQLAEIAARYGFGVTPDEVKAIGTIARRIGLGETELDGTHLALPCWCDPSVVNTKSC